MPRYWYISAELCREINTWEELTVSFAHKFDFVDVNTKVNNVLQIIWDVFLKFFLVAYPGDPHAHCLMQSMMECYNLSGESKDDDELCNINIQETEGSQDVTALVVPIDPMTQPLKIKKVNIGTEENPKFSNIEDYWDEETMVNITDLLHEFQDLFQTKFS